MAPNSAALVALKPWNWKGKIRFSARAGECASGCWPFVGTACAIASQQSDATLTRACVR